MAGNLQLDAVQITGTTYSYCSQIMLHNPLNGTPMAVCYEDTVTALSSGTQTSTPNRVLSLPYNPAQVINILDPTTGNTVTTMPLSQVFGILFSIYGAARAAADQPTPPSSP